MIGPNKGGVGASIVSSAADSALNAAVLSAGITVGDEVWDWLNIVQLTTPNDTNSPPGALAWKNYGNVLSALAHQ